MRTLFVLLFATCLTFALPSCGGDETDEPNAHDETDKTDDTLDEPKYELGDGIGSFGVSLEVQIAEDLKRFIAEGADPNKSYMIEHHLAAGNLGTARKIVEWGEENGFTPVFDESAVVPGEWIHVDLVKESKLEFNSLWSDTKGVTSLAQYLMCEYDGWGFRDTP